MMQTYVQEVANDLGIAAEIIAPKKELTAAMLGDTSGRVFSGWREKIVGAELRNLISPLD